MKADRVLFLACLTLALFALAGCSSSEEPDKPSASASAPAEGTLHNGVDISRHRELTVITYSGSYEDIQRKNLVRSNFEQEYNCTITYIQAVGTDTLEKVRNKEADVVFTDFIYACQGEAQNLWEKLDDTKVPNLGNLYDFAKVGDYVVLHDIGVYGIVYNPEKVQNPPQHWVDLWKDEYKGKIMMRSFRTDSIDLMIFMAKLEGGDERHIDAGFAKMAEIAPNIHTWSHNHSQTLELFRSGDAAVGMWTDGRVAWAAENDVHLEYVLPEEGGFLLTSAMSVVANTKNVDLALAYMNAELSPEWQAVHAEALGYFPTNVSAYGLLSDNAKSMMAFTDKTAQSSYKMCDWPYVVSVYSQWAERWEKEVLGGQ